MGNICGGDRKLAPAGPPEATGEGSLSSPQAWEKPHHKDRRRSVAFLSSFIARRDSTHTSGANTSGAEESGNDNVDGTTLMVPPSTNLAQLQSMMDIADEGTTLDLQNATIQMDGAELAGGCLRVSRSIRLFNGTLLLPPHCSVSLATPDCVLTLSEISIGFDSLGAKMPAISVSKGAHLHLDDCCIEGGSAGDAVQVSGTGSSMRARSCEIRSSGQGAAVTAVRGGHATVIDCSLQGAAISDGAIRDLEGCTMCIAGTYGLNVSDRGTAHLVGCFLSDSGMHNAVVSGGAAAFLQRCRTFGNSSRRYVAYGNNSKLEVTDCLWSPLPPPKMLQGATRQHTPVLPEWLR
ncbi:hypothetical protein DUNSADRAFT_12924 [Dunaliella salina]|uniref:Right handed beta helix domain-containing protein n=1 Tax=Dunaliella salina TaxID=3046 RepID=A0ABQ7GAG1_DUNSA|nr:hypothetical protein DUNSADRAFT_12924 [Dunaliella salina]|eukprot:KAF5831590.1 hypothetical protein DUNSADRAFT_12924 [Dunaliella salina]